MYEDVIALRNFYHTPLGQHLAGQLRPYISKFWQVIALIIGALSKNILATIFTGLIIYWYLIFF